MIDIRKIISFIALLAISNVLINAQPTLIAYTPDPTVDLTPTLYWNSVSGATHYKIQIDDDVSFSTTLVDTIISASTFFTPLSPLQNGEIYWRVSSSLDTTLFSSLDSFQIKTFPDLVNATYDPTSDKSPTLSWNSVSSASSYRVQIDDVVAFASPNLDTIISSATSLNTFLSGSDTVASQTYYWRVATNYDTTAFSPNGTVNYQEVSITRYNGSVERNSSPSFNWSAYTGASDYRIQIASNTAFTTPVVDYYTSGATTYNSAGLGTGNKYWRVSTNQDYNEFSRMDSLRISGSPVPVFFNGDTIYSSKPKLVWHKVAGVNSYHIQIDTVKTFDMLYYSGSNYADTAGNVDTTFTYSNNLTDGKYYWRVDTNYSGDYSEIDSFYVKDTTTRWYVRPGSSNGNGTMNSPFEKVSEVAGYLTNGDTLMLALGEYYTDTGYVEPDTLKSVVVLGGWDSLFTTRDSRLYESVFNGYDSISEGPFYLYNDVYIDGITMKGYQYTALNIDYKHNIKISNCTFLSNGTAMYIYESGNIKITNNILAMNGFGIRANSYNVSDSINAEIYNNTFVFNDSCALKNDSLSVNVRNNIFAYNQKAYQTKGGKRDTVAYNSFFNNDTAIYNIYYPDSLLVIDINQVNSDTHFIAQNNSLLDPVFVDTTSTNLDLHLAMGSSCFDAGDPSFDYSLEPIPNGSRINLGAYGGTQWASVAGVIPTITLEPTLDTVAVGDSLTFSITATGTATLTYQWQKNGSNIAGATSANLLIDSVVMSDTGSYRAIVTNSFGSDTSISLSFKSIKPTSIINPTADTAYLNDTVNFISASNGTGPLTYQWLKDGTIISGEASPTLSVVIADLGKSGSYQVITYNNYGFDTSEVEGLTVIDNVAPDPVTALTLSEVNCSTVSVSWTASASGDAIDVMVRASVITMPTSKDSGEYGQLVSNPVTSLSLSSLPKYGAKVFVSTFVKDNSGNWSSFNSASSDTIILSDGEPPVNYIALNITNNGDTSITLNFDINDTIASDAEYMIFNMNSDSAQIRFSEQDTFAYKDTTFYRSITEQGAYYISWAPIDSNGNIGDMLSDTFTLQNSLPHFVFGDSVELNEDVEWTMENFVNDYNLDDIKVSVISGPTALILDTTINKIMWTPLNEDVGSHLLILSADDQVDGAVLDTLTIIVKNVNDIPVIQSLVFPDTLIEDSIYPGILYFKDPDAIDSFALTFNNISWISFEGYTYNDADDLYSASLNIAPLKNDTGTFSISIILNDLTNAKDTVSKTVYILNSNYPPEIKSINILDTVYEDSVVEGVVEIFDGNVNDSLTVVMTGASWLTLIKDSENADGTKIYKIKGIPLQEDTGITTILIKVADGEGEIDTASMNIMVINTNDPPIISMVSKKVSGGAVEYLMSATDDFDTTFTYVGGITTLAGDTVFIDSNGIGKFLIYPIWDGTYLAHTSVTDNGGLETFVTDTLKITNVNSNTWKANKTWSMISIPSSYYKIDSAINNEVIQFWDESKPYKNIYQYYNRVSDASQLNLTSSYWLKNDSVDIKVAIDTALTNRNGRAVNSKTISLNMDSYGWNMISSPFAYPVSWNSELTLWEWDERTKEYIDAQNIIYPWKGYWVLAESNADTIVLKGEPNFSSRKRRGASRCNFTSKDNWIYNVVLESKVGSDKENLFGFNSNALDGRDKMDRAEPPRLNSSPYIFFTNPLWGGNIKEFASDIRKEWKGTAVYNIGISNSAISDEPLKLRVDGNNEDHKIYLFIRNNNEIIEYNDGDVVSIEPSNKDKYVTLFASSNKNFLSTLPLNFKAAYPYPNPFRNIANIKYTLPYRWENDGMLISKPYNVKIKVYDIKGRVVRELFNGKQNVGFHKVIWDGKVNHGSLASSGAYFVKVTAGDFVTVKKIMVLK